MHGTRGTTCKWFTNYLPCKTQYLFVDFEKCDINKNALMLEPLL